MAGRPPCSALPAASDDNSADQLHARIAPCNAYRAQRLGAFCRRGAFGNSARRLAGRGTSLSYAVKRQGKEAVKKMQGMFDDIAKGSYQALITAPLNKNIRATELCHEAVSHFIYDNLCSSTSPQSKDTTDKTLLFNSDRGGKG